MLTLEESIEQSKICLDLLLDNKYIQAIEVSGQYADQSLYHAHGHSLLLWFKAYLSLDMTDIKEAQKSSIDTLDMCDSIRPQTMKDSFFYKLFFKVDYQKFTDEEIHAELIRTEQILFSSMMEFFVDQSLFVLIKVSYRLRSCYSTYKAFGSMGNVKKWTSQISYSNFICGVKLGLGVYNLMVSLMPEKIMALLSVVGYKGNAKDGMQLLIESSEANNALRSFGAQMILNGYECYINQLFNPHCVEAPVTESNIKIGLSKNPSCIWYAVFKARICLIRKDIESASKIIKSCLEGNNFDVKQMITLYVWELMWCEAMSGNWLDAADQCLLLRQNFTWSLPTMYYIEAAFRYMDYESRVIDSGGEFSNTKEAEQLKQQIGELLREVPTHVIRYAGRRVPIEKFVCEKAEKFEKEGNLTIAGYELLLTWNMTIFIEGQEKYVNPILKHVDKCLKVLDLDNDDESYLLLCLMKGTCYRLLSRYSEAETELLKVIAKVNQISYDRHLAPFAALELGIVKTKQKQFDEARQWLIQTKNEMKGYALELILQFRAHKAYQVLRRERQLHDC